MKHLITFTFGPVQSFLAQARKTQDLWAGSDILSDICRNTIKYARDNYKLGHQFPDMGDSSASLPNRFSGIIETDDIQAAGQDLKGELERIFTDKAQTILSNAGIKPAYFQGQIERLLEIYWVAVPFDESTNGYKSCFNEAQKLLAACKNARPFVQMNEPGGRKCALSGERNALVYRKKALALRKNLEDEKPPFLQNAVEKSEPHDLNPGEAIDAIGWVKRRWKRNGTSAFPSVAEIALGEVYEKANELDCWSDFRNKFEHFDPQYLYEENLTDATLNRYEPLKKAHDSPDARKKIRNLRDQIESKLRDAGYFLQKHYALVMLDGDDMGKWMSGNPPDGEPITDLLKFHAEIGPKMKQYIEDVDEIFNGKGKLIYCGGDDVLGFINLNHLSEVLRKLREKFPKFAAEGAAVQSTASAGVVIAHYKTPLSVVLQETRAAEKRAKNVDGKNSLAITVLKHSGEIDRLELPWFDKAENGAGLWLTDIINQVGEHVKSELLSKSAQRNMLEALVAAESPLPELNTTLIRQALIHSLALREKQDGSDEESKIRDIIQPYLQFLKFVDNKVAKFKLLLEIANYIGRKSA